MKNLISTMQAVVLVIVALGAHNGVAQMVTSPETPLERSIRYGEKREKPITDVNEASAARGLPTDDRELANLKNSGLPKGSVQVGTVTGGNQGADKTYGSRDEIMKRGRRDGIQETRTTNDRSFDSQ